MEKVSKRIFYYNWFIYERSQKIMTFVFFLLETTNVYILLYSMSSKYQNNTSMGIMNTSNSFIEVETFCAICTKVSHVFLY